MTSLVDEILFAFANERDTNGNEYKLRYPPSQPGNRRFAEQVTSMFPTRLINVALQHPRCGGSRPGQGGVSTHLGRCFGGA
jgi:hypothetical protein